MPRAQGAAEYLAAEEDMGSPVSIAARPGTLDSYLYGDNMVDSGRGETAS